MNLKIVLFFWKSGIILVSFVSAVLKFSGIFGAFYDYMNNNCNYYIREYWFLSTESFSYLKEKRKIESKIIDLLLRHKYLYI